MTGEAPGLDEALAWFGVVADPARRVDQAIECLQPMAGKVVLEVGRHALSHAMRHAARSHQVFAAETGEWRPPIAGLPPNLSRIGPSGGSLPLRDKTIDLAILRFDGVKSWPVPNLDSLSELDRLVSPDGHVVGVLTAMTGNLGALIADCLGAEAALLEVPAVFESAGFREEIVQTVWQAPGRSILRRLIAAEYGETESTRSLSVSELDGAYRIYWRRQA